MNRDLFERGKNYDVTHDYIPDFKTEDEKQSWWAGLEARQLTLYDSKFRLKRQAILEHGNITPCNGKTTIDECYSRYNNKLYFWFNVASGSTKLLSETLSDSVIRGLCQEPDCLQEAHGRQNYCKRHDSSASPVQQLEAAILLVRTRAEELFLAEGQFDTLEKCLDLLAECAPVEKKQWKRG